MVVLLGPCIVMPLVILVFVQCIFYSHNIEVIVNCCMVEIIGPGIMVLFNNVQCLIFFYFLLMW